MTNNSTSTPVAAPVAGSAKPSSMRSTILVSAATMASRLLGLVREQLFAVLLGAGYYADAFVVAFRIPNLLRDLFAEGALSAAFVPTFAKVEKEGGKEAGWALANKVMGAILIVVGLITVLGMVFSESLVLALAHGFSEEPGKVELTAWLARLMMPFLPLVSFAALTMGMLNAKGRFGTPALAPALFNMAAIVVGAGLWIAGVAPEGAVIGWAIGTLAGGALQFLVQLPPLHREGFRLRPRLIGLWRDPEIRRIATLMAPATVGLAATQLNIFINTQFASDEPGANAWLNYAFRLMYLPIGIFGVAIATVTATTLARKAADKDIAGLKRGLGLGLRHVAFLTVPSTVGLVVLAQPIIALIYEHGRFTAFDTQQTAAALTAYALGLYAYSGVKVVAPAFYALERPRVPLAASASAVMTNLSLNLLFHQHLGYVGLALGTSLGAMVNLFVLTGMFRRATPGLPGAPGIFSQLGRVAAASLIMGVAVHFGLQLLDAGLLRLGPSMEGIAVRLFRVGAGVVSGAVIYFVACRLLRVDELTEMLEAVKRRRRR